MSDNEHIEDPRIWRDEEIGRLRAEVERLRGDTLCPDCGIPEMWCRLVSTDPKRCWRWDDEKRRELEAEVERLRKIEQAARPIADAWDFHAADYLTDLVDGEEQRIIPASVVAEIINQQRALREALAAPPADE